MYCLQTDIINVLFIISISPFQNVYISEEKYLFSLELFEIRQIIAIILNLF